MFDFGVLLLIILTILPIQIVLVKFIKDLLNKIFFIFITIPILIYSGLGICYLNEPYPLCVYFIFYYYIIMMILFFGLKNKVIFKKNKVEIYENNFLEKNSLIILLIYFSTYIITLIIPENRLIYLINPPTSTTNKLYESILFNSANKVVDLFLMIRVLLTPLFFIIINIFISQKKKLKLVIILFLWIYLSYISIGYMGRSEILKYIVFIFFILLLCNKKIREIRFNQFFILILIFILLIPIFYEYQYTRGGKEIELTWNGILYFIKDELMFSKNYLNILEMNYPSYKYLLFFILLPIPSLIFPHKSSLLLSTNVFFTEALTGIKYGALGYSGLLPSIFGEALLVFGKNFYYVHAVIFSLIILIFIKIIRKNNNLQILYVYFVVSSIFIARGGSQGFFGELINYIVSYYAFKLLISLLNKKGDTRIIYE